MALVPHPFIYEINTWVWLRELGVGLADVPVEEWDAIAGHEFDAVWLMGVWERSPAGVEIALQNDGLVQSFQRALPDLTRADVVGSPYCIRDYKVAAELGGDEGLAAAREALGPAHRPFWFTYRVRIGVTADGDAAGPS